MAAEASGHSRVSLRHPNKSVSNQNQNSDGNSAPKSRNARQSATSKSTPTWLSSERTEEGLEFDLADPEDLLRKMESVDLTEDETEELLKRAYAINKQLKKADGRASSVQRTKGGSAPQPTAGRARTRGNSGMTQEHLPELPQGRQTSLSSGVYSRTGSSSPASSQGSARYTSYHGAQAVYGTPAPHPPSKSNSQTYRRTVLE